MTNYVNQWIKRKFQELREKFGNKCKSCGTTNKLHFAHREHNGLNGRGRGRKERYYDILRHPEQYVLLCQKCHTRYDRGEINV